MDKRTELMEAAMKGIREYLASTRGAHCCGPGAFLYTELGGFVVKTSEGIVSFEITTTP